MISKYGYVYKIVNDVNNKIYIGQSTRWDMIDSYMGSGTELLQAMRDIGKEHFKKKLLGAADTREELDYLELVYIASELVNGEDLYNVHEGGPRATGYVGNKIKKVFGADAEDTSPEGLYKWYTTLSLNKNEIINIISESYQKMDDGKKLFYAMHEIDLLERHAVYYDVGCNRCGALPGDVCRTRTGNPTVTHLTRKEKTVLFNNLKKSVVRPDVSVINDGGTTSDTDGTDSDSSIRSKLVRLIRLGRSY